MRFVQHSLYGAPDEPDDPNSDDQCTPQTHTAILHSMWPSGVDLDCTANGWSMELGFVNAAVAWTERDDCMVQATWNVRGPSTTCFGQPPYSTKGAPIIRHFCANVWDAGELWESLWLVRLDPSTTAWSELRSRATSLVLFKDRLPHYLNGVQRTASNICSSMHFFTRGNKDERHEALKKAVGGLGWCYREENQHG